MRLDRNSWLIGYFSHQFEYNRVVVTVQSPFFVERQEIMTEYCTECGAIWKDDRTCETDFHQMLFWENEFPELGVVHHLMVLNYHLQHPSLYSPDGLRFSMNLLREFVEQGVSTEQSRQRYREMLSSTHRTWKIKGCPDAHGSYPHPIEWTMRAADVIEGGAESYIENVEKWSRSILESLRLSQNAGI